MNSFRPKAPNATCGRSPKGVHLLKTRPLLEYRKKQGMLLATTEHDARPPHAYFASGLGP